MTCILAIDPGNDTGWAILTNGELTNAGLGDPRIFDPSEFSRVVIECPRIYPHGSKGDPNGLIKLAVLVGEYKEAFQDWCPVQLVYPSEWKAQIPKTKHLKDYIVYKRAKARYPYLDKFFTCAESKKHNIADAIGIAIYSSSSSSSPSP
jgi:hypothetical protein